MISTGCAHGRFQPFHNGHLEYVAAAKQRCAFLWIGLTQFNIRHLAPSQEAAHRQALSSNPFTYWQRVGMIEAALLELSVPRSEFGFSPFPIENPSLLPDFIGLEVFQFTTIVEEWNREKVNRLKRQGYAVEVLWERTEKTPTGQQVRKLISDGDDSWRKLVPPAVAGFIRQNAPEVFPKP